MALLIHATVTVSGDPAQLEAFRARMALALEQEPAEGRFEERPGGADLIYDVKVAGGIPFPLFVRASQEFPDLPIRAEWINAQTSERGAATIVNGMLRDTQLAELDHKPRSADPVYLEVGSDACLRLAMTFFQVARGEYRGYAVSAQCDAMFRLARDESANRLELLATSGSEQWAERWAIDLASGNVEYAELDPALPIADDDYHEVEKLALEFAQEWLWFAEDSEEDTAIERDRYRRYGYAVRDANVKAERIRRISRREDGEGAPFVYSTLGDDALWVKDAVLRCWVEGAIG